MEEDHRRIDRLLAEAADRSISAEAYQPFRAALLRHIGMEEKILLPEAQRAAGAPLDDAARLRRDHGLLVSLLVPTPTPEIVEALRELLAAHNRIEEEAAGGVYARCDGILAAEQDAIVERLHAAPETPLVRHFDGPQMARRLPELLAAARQRARAAMP